MVLYDVTVRLGDWSRGNRTALTRLLRTAKVWLNRELYPEVRS